MTMTDALPTSRVAAELAGLVQLLKPRVMSLVVFTAMTGWSCAGPDESAVWAAIAVLCIAVGAGGRGSLNMALEADIDAKMRRTRGRPVAGRSGAGRRRPGLGVVLSMFSVMLLGMTVNWLAAGLLA
jgi:protoheme IX farnesyltransferase